MTKVGIIVGSTRKNSFSGMWAKAMAELYPAGTEVTFIDIANLPLYNQDYDENSPQEYTDFREQVAAQDGILFVTPEHNRSVPAALKNALDVASRPWGESVWGGKPALVASHSISGLSGFGANHHLRQSLAFLDMPTVQQPELYLANSQDYFDDNGTLNNEDTKEFLKGAVDAHFNLIEKLSK